MMTKKILINGTISADDDAEVYGWLGYTVYTPNMLRTALAEQNPDEPDDGTIELQINSPGGDVFAGSEIYTVLRDSGAQVTAKITGLAASAASVIAMAANKIEMSPTAQMMIHRTSSAVQGNVEDFAEVMQMMDSSDQAILDVYAQRTGQSEEQIYNLMVNETFLNARRAVEMGFADEIMFEPVKAVNSVVPTLTAEVREKVRNLLRANAQPQKPQEPQLHSKSTKSLSNSKLAIFMDKI